MLKFKDKTQPSSYDDRATINFKVYLVIAVKFEYVFVSYNKMRVYLVDR